MAHDMTMSNRTSGALPGWVPETVRLYLSHTEDGLSLREIARQTGCAASTVLRRVRRFENRRDDPLVDAALVRLGTAPPDASPTRHPEIHSQKGPAMRAELRQTAESDVDSAASPDETTIEGDARRILRRLCETGAVLAIAGDLDMAAVLRTLPDGRTATTATIARTVAQAFALKAWIACRTPGRVAVYEITAAGRTALKRLLAEDERDRGAGFAEGMAPFAHQAEGEGGDDLPDAAQRVRYNLAEAPIAVLARRRDKGGEPFLDASLVAAAERLREDFELAQMGPRTTQNWDRFLTAGDAGVPVPSDRGAGPRAARDRVAAALADLGPGLGDMVLRCCCFLEGLETAEKRLGWSARSGKIVLRIALVRLKRHYAERTGAASPLIG